VAKKYNETDIGTFKLEFPTSGGWLNGSEAQELHLVGEAAAECGSMP
jgi:hypothetical protein